MPSKPTYTLSAPLSSDEIAVLRDASTGRFDVDKSTGLVARGYLAKVKAKPGLVVTPEGLAALLDVVPIASIAQAPGCSHSPE